MKLKKIFCVLSLIFSLVLIPCTNVEAANVTISASKTEVEVGEKVTITVGFTAAAWNLTVSGDGITGAKYAAPSSDITEKHEEHTFDLDTSKAGTYKVYVTGDITDGDGNTIEGIEKICVVNVNEKPTPPPVDPDPEEPENPPVDPEPEDPEPEEPELSSDARLYSLSVDKGKLTPAFSSYIYEYTVDLTSEDNEIEISASCYDDNATLSGTGLKTIKVGSNSFTIDVKAEDGTRQAYTINVNVKEVPTVFFDFEDKKLGIMGEVENADIPKGFSETTITVQEKEVKAFVNAKDTMTLLFMVDEEQNKGFYVYDEEDGILGLYRPVYIDGKEFFILNIPEKAREIEKMNFTSLSLEEETFDGWLFADEDMQNYSLMYLMNTKGEIGYYVYDGTAKKIQAYPDSYPLTADDLIDFLNTEPETPWLLYAGIGVVVLLVIGVIVFVVMKKKKKHIDDDFDDDSHEDTIIVKDRTLVTDDTFFKQRPSDATTEFNEETTNDEAPLIIETALSGLNSEDLNDTNEFSEEMVSELVVEESTDDVEDDWLDEKMINIFTSDDDDEE